MVVFPKNHGNTTKVDYTGASNEIERSDWGVGSGFLVNFY